MEAAKNDNGYNTEQALGLLFYHKYDVESARRDMGNYAPMDDHDWSHEEKVNTENLLRNSFASPDEYMSYD